MTTYPLREIPSDLWIRAKHYAIDKKITLRELILLALERFLDESEN